MEDTSLMPFGKHKGKEMQDVPANYLLWLGDQLKGEIIHPDSVEQSLVHYIEENRELLENEESEGKPDSLDY